MNISLRTNAVVDNLLKEAKEYYNLKDEAAVFRRGLSLLRLVIDYSREGKRIGFVNSDDTLFSVVDMGEGISKEGEEAVKQLTD